MTITNIYQPEVLPIVGVGPYAFSFDIIEATDIRIFFEDVLQPPSVYTVVLAGSEPIFSGGTITLLNPPASGELIIARDTLASQEVVYQPYTPFPAKVTEFTIDKLTLLVQEGGGGSGGSGGLPTDPIFSSVTIANDNPALLLQDSTGQRVRFGASAGAGNPGIDYSADNGATFLPMFTFTDSSDPLAIGETQIYGPDGSGGTTAYITTVVAEEIWLFKSLRLQDSKRIYGLLDPIDTDEAASKGYVDAVAGGGGSDPVFNSVTIQNPNPVLLLDDSTGQFARFGASALAGNPGIEYSPDAGATWLPMFTFTDSSDPLAIGETQMYGPDGSGGTTVYLSTVVAEQVHFAKNISMENNRILGLLDPLDANEAATKGYVDATAGGAPDLDPVFNSVTVQNTNPVYLLEDGTGQLSRFGASALAGNPGIEYSPDNGVNWLPMFTFTDSSDPLAIGETQIYGPDGSGGTQAYITTVQVGGGQVYVFKPLSMNFNALVGLPNAIAGDSPVTLSQYNDTLATALANISHNTLLDLGADDHTQYYNQSRGDNRYVRNTQLNVAGAAYAGGKIISDGAGSQSVANCFGVSSASISGNTFLINLIQSVGTLNNIVVNCTSNTGLAVGTTTATVVDSNTILIAVFYWDTAGGGSWIPATFNGLQFNFTVHNAGA